MGGGIVEESFCYEEETQLTVLKTSHFFEGDGFTVYDSNGQIVFRVDSYGPEAGNLDELVLMNATGKCLLTVRRKKTGQPPLELGTCKITKRKRKEKEPWALAVGSPMLKSAR